MLEQPGANAVEVEVFSRLEAAGLVPVLALDSIESAIPIGEILLEEGLPVVEITFRTDAAAEVISCLAGRLPDLLVGAGTLLSREQVRQACDSGARFGVAPGFSERTLEAAREYRLPFLPGVATPSEIERGLASGLHLLKWFPAEPLGGAFGLSQAAAPFLHTGLRFVPSGGISAATAPSYLKLPAVLAAGGSWMVPQTAVRAGDWAGVRQGIHQAAALVREVRGG